MKNHGAEPVVTDISCSVTVAAEPLCVPPHEMSDLKRCLKMKKRRSILIILICVIVAFASLAWYHGFIPIASGPVKAGVRHALNLTLLPSSTQVNASGSESWTDYIFEAELSISSDQFDRLLSGREFEEDTETRLRKGMTNAYRISEYSGFEIDAIWSWSHRPSDLREGDHGSSCIVYANKARDRVLIRYIAD